MGEYSRKVFIIKSVHENDGNFSSIEAVCASRERAERWLEEDGWTRIPAPSDFAWGRRYMDDDPDASEFDVSNGWEGANIFEEEVLE